MSEEFSVGLLVWEKDRYYYADECHAVSIYPPYKNGSKAIQSMIELVSIDDVESFCSYRAEPGAFFLGGHQILFDRYQVHTGGYRWDLAKVDYQSVTRLWEVLIDHYWEVLDIHAGETYLYNKWKSHEYVDFAVYNHQLLFWNQMYRLCGYVKGVSNVTTRIRK